MKVLDLETFEAWGKAKEIIDRIVNYGIARDVEELLDAEYDNLSEEEVNQIFEEDYIRFLEPLGVREKLEIERDIQELKLELWELDENKDEAEIKEIEDKLSVLDDELLFWAD